MQQFFEFVSNHLFLWSLFAAILLMITLLEVKSQSGGLTKVSPSQLTDLINRQQAQLLDVRDSALFAQGHITGALNIAVEDIAANLKKLKKYQNKPLVLVCDNGQQSLQAGATLKQNGYEQLYFLAGGLRSWEEAQMPLIKGAA